MRLTQKVLYPLSHLNAFFKNVISVFKCTVTVLLDNIAMKFVNNVSYLTETNAVLIKQSLFLLPQTVETNILPFASGNLTPLETCCKWNSINLFVTGGFHLLCL